MEDSPKLKLQTDEAISEKAHKKHGTEGKSEQGTCNWDTGVAVEFNY
jgi:hypothetical protein